jgi:hypothetical protein
MTDSFDRRHYYHAEAHVLSGELRTPLNRDIKPQSFVKLSDGGGYESKLERDFHLEAAISFESAHTQVAGYPASWPCDGWATLTTAEIVGLNFLDVIKADRVVGQMRTIYPAVGYVPIVSFVGTHFDNLRIGGHPVKLDLDLGLFGDKPVDDLFYTQEPLFVRRVIKQYERIAACGNLPVELDGRYNQIPSSFVDGETVECSLVNQAEGSYPGRTFGHIIHIPHFGIVTLAKLRVMERDFEPETEIPRNTQISLTMIDVELNCTGDGRVRHCEMIAGGHTKP